MKNHSCDEESAGTLPRETRRESRRPSRLSKSLIQVAYPSRLSKSLIQVVYSAHARQASNTDPDPASPGMRGAALSPPDTIRTRPESQTPRRRHIGVAQPGQRIARSACRPDVDRAGQRQSSARPDRHSEGHIRSDRRDGVATIFAHHLR
jgi:hypothetical protein